MDIKQYAKQSKIPLKTLHWMVRKNMLQNPLTQDDLTGLSLLEKLWGDRSIIRSMISKFSRVEKLRFLETANLATRWERYAFTRFKNLPPGKKIKMKKVIDEIELTFGFEIKPWHKNRLYKVRQKVYNIRRQEKASVKC